MAKLSKNKVKTSQRKSNLFFFCLVFLPIAQFLIMYVFVNLNSFVMAFRGYSVDDGWYWVGFDNFIQLFNQITSVNTLKYAFQNSLSAFLITLPFSLVAVFFSYYIFKHFAGWKLFRTMLFLPQILSGGVLILMFNNFGDGFLSLAIKNLFGVKLGSLTGNEEIGFTVMIIYNIFLSFGTSVIMYTNSMSNIDESVMEAARLDGANGFDEFFKIVLPQIIPVFSVFVTIHFATIFTSQYYMYSIYGSTLAKDTQYTVGYYIFREIKMAQTGNYANFPLIAALGFVTTLITAPLVFISRRIFNRIDPMEN